MSSLFDIGKSGIQSYRQALAVTGQNIANINTDGYKRRGANLEEVATGQFGINNTGDSPGLGVRVSEIRRAFDEFLLNKARSSTAYAESTATFSTSIKQLEDLILPGEANLGAAIGRFFTGLQEIASTPNDIAARTVALENAKQMADTFTETASLIETYMQGLTTQANEQVDSVNVLTNEIANLNIQLARASGTKPNNALLDSRDALIDRLSKLVEVNVDLTGKGVALVTLGENMNGPRLVENDRATTLGVERQNERMAFILSPNAENILTSQVTNGSLNGLEMAYATAIDVMAEIDNLAFVLVREMNAIHQQGLNLEGEKSGDLFRAIDVVIEPNPTNTGTASTEIKVNDFTKVQENRITFTYDKDAAVWNGRADDGSLIVSGRNNVTLPGVEIRFLGAPKGFDQFIYDPVKGSAGGVAVAIKRPHDFAAASPLLVSSNPGNSSNAAIDVRSTTPLPAPSLPSVETVFSNNRSAVAATTFLSGGAVAVIPANASEIDMFSLASQSTARYSLSPGDLGQISELAIDITSIAADGTESTKTVAFDVDFASAKGFDGDWIDFQQVADLINVGTITGVVQGTSDEVTIAELGGFMSGNAGNLTLSLNENNISAARMTLKNGRISDGAVSARVAEASDIQIFTREGRHVAGTTQPVEGQEALQALMTAENGFIDGAIYRSDYLNKSGDDGYLGMSVEASYDSNVLFDVEEGNELTTVRFSVLEGIDTNEASVYGQSASARTVDYRMNVGDIAASLTAADIDSPDGPTVAKAMINELRGNAPIASLIGTSPANIQTEDQLRLSFEGQQYTLKMVDGEPLISGGEDGRLLASFDAANHIKILSSSGSLTCSSIDIVAEIGDEENIAAARRFGLMVDDTPVTTRFAGEFAFIPGTGDASVDNVVTMTFDKNDSYNLDFVFDRRAESRLSSTSDMAFTLNGLNVVDGDASAVAAAINAAVAANETDGDGGSDMTGIVTATAIGNVVQIVVSDGIETEISAPNGSLSSGDGKIDIQYHAAQPVSEPALAALQLEEGEIFQFKVNGQTVQVDSTATGISAATGGTLAGVIADAADALRNAIETTSGVGTVTVTTANSLSGTSMIFDISDATGGPVVLSDFDATTSGEAYFLSGASSDTTLEDEVGVVEMVNDSAAATQNGMFANAKSLAQLDDSFVARSFDLRLAGDAIEVVATDGNVEFAYDNTDTISVSGSWTDGQEVSMDIFGETVSITVADNDSYANTLEGITEQLTAAINGEGIPGLTAAKNANASTLTLTANVNVTGATTDLGTEFIVHTVGNNATSQIRISGTDVAVASATAATYTAGDRYTFSVLGNQVSFVVGADGYADTIEGVSEQMKDLVDALNISGLSVTAQTSTDTTAGIDITRSLTGTATTGSTVVTNIKSQTVMTDVSASGSSLAKQRYRLSNMPGEDLIILVGSEGARRVSMQYDMLPEALTEIQREIDIRVADAAAGTIEMFDVATGTSLATRTLDEEQRVSALEFDIAFTGILQDNDAFRISDNSDGLGDNRNLDGLLRLQTKNIFGPGSGGFQKVFSTTVAKLGAVVQSGDIAAQAAEALRDASLEAESAYTGVNLDTEAANLIEQQQAYQASARVLATARELFDTLIQVV